MEMVMGSIELWIDDSSQGQLSQPQTSYEG
jgi:hypothetical protein